MLDNVIRQEDSKESPNPTELGLQELRTIVSRPDLLALNSLTLRSISNRLQLGDGASFVRWSTNLFMRFCAMEGDMTPRILDGLSILEPVVKKLQIGTVQDDALILRTGLSEKEPQQFRELHAMLVDIFSATEENLQRNPTSRIGLDQLEWLLEEADFVLMFDGANLKRDWDSNKNGGLPHQSYANITAILCEHLSDWKSLPRLQLAFSVAFEVMPMLADQKWFDTKTLLQKLGALEMGWLVVNFLKAQGLTAEAEAREGTSKGGEELPEREEGEKELPEQEEGGEALPEQEQSEEEAPEEKEPEEDGREKGEREEDEPEEEQQHKLHQDVQETLHGIAKDYEAAEAVRCRKKARRM